MARESSVIIERDVDGYCVASVPGLRGRHTQVQGENVEARDFIGVQKISVA